SLSYYQDWGGPILIRNTTSHGSVSQPINPEYVTYYQRDGSLYIWYGTTVVLDDKVIFCEGTNGEIIDDGAELVIGQGSSFNGVTTGIEDYVNITLAPDYLEQNSTGNIVRAQADDVEPYGNISDLSRCELYARSLEEDVKLSDYCSMYNRINGYWEFLMDVPSLSQWNNTWVRDFTENEYIRGYFKVINGDIYTISNVLIHSPVTKRGTIAKNEMWCGNISLTGNVTVASGIKLIIIEGTEIKFPSGKKLTINGILDAQGVLTNPIIFTSNNSSPSAGNWYGIRFEDSSVDANCILKYCDIQYAQYGVYCNRANPKIENNTITNNYYGVYAYYASPSIHSCWIHDNTYGLLGASSSMVVTNNKIYDNSQDCGYFVGGTPRFYTNTIYDNTGNGLYFYSSSGKIGYSSGTSQGLNEIRDNGSWGIYAEELTEIFMGSSDSEGNRIGGYNSVMDNTMNEVCSNAAHVEAEYNYWGTSSPTSALFTLVYGGTIDYIPYLTSDPNGGSSLSKSSVLSGSGNVADNVNNRWAGYNPANLNFNKLSDLWLYGLELTLHNRPEKAIEIYKMLIEKFPKSTEAKKAMVKVHHLLRECDEKSQENYFETLMQKGGGCKEEYKSTAMILTAYTYCDMGLPVQAINIFEEVIKEYPDSSCTLGAL
ncbi:MAG: tetratricopeptide repeat protein, partial [Candidatus Marinimicrobia bacterium]|nr:tetratricopeptide repeat protein [Candidatus Neomarinimicrobiota bacterium]